MHALLVAVFGLSLTAPPLALHDSLQVVTGDSTLGEEIARAARRYLRGTVQVRGAADGAADGGHPEHEAALTVRQEPASSGQRWVLVLSSGSAHAIRRTIELHEVPTRFDLAEAVAIGLPDMLARLDEQAPATPPRSLTLSSSAPIATRHTLAMVARPIESVPEKAPRVEPEKDTNSKPSLPNTNPPATNAPSAQPPPAPPAEVPKSPPPPQPIVVKKEQPAEIVKTPPHIEPIPQETPPTRIPSAAIGLTASGAIILLSGIGTGAAAQLAARQVDTPTQMHFDADLDRRGKALNTATIVLDSVGGAVLAGGSAWILARVIKARREAPKVALLPSGAGLVLKGSF